MFSCYNSAMSFDFVTRSEYNEPSATVTRSRVWISGVVCLLSCWSLDREHCVCYLFSQQSCIPLTCALRNFENLSFLILLLPPILISSCITPGHTVPSPADGTAHFQQFSPICDLDGGSHPSAPARHILMHFMCLVSIFLFPPDVV